MKLEDSNIIKIISNLSDSEQDILIENIYQVVDKIHDEKLQEDWLDMYNVEINLSLFNHGLIKSSGLKDYILSDYLQNNAFFIKDRKISRLIKNSSILDIKIYDDLNVEVSKSEKFGDKILDYLDLNIIAFYNEKFAKKLMNRLINTNHKLRFLKLFSIYSSKYLIDLIVEKDKIENEEEIEKYNEIIEYIIDSFDDFTNYIPKWMR